MIMAFEPLAGTERRGDKFSPDAFKEKPRPVTVVVTIVKQLIPTEHQLKTNTLSFQFVCYTN